MRTVQLLVRFEVGPQILSRSRPYSFVQRNPGPTPLLPVNADTFADHVTVAGTVKDPETGINSLFAVNSGIPGSTFSLLQQNFGAYSGDIPLAIGPNTIEVRASNAAGLESKSSVSILRDSMPQLTITSPSSGTTLQDPQVTVRGTLRTDLPASAFMVSASGVITVPVATTVTGVLEYTLNQVPLLQGYNTIEVIAATNTIQVKASVTITYQKRDEPAPEITITAPQPETLLGDRTFILSGWWSATVSADGAGFPSAALSVAKGSVNNGLILSFRNS